MRISKKLVGVVCMIATLGGASIVNAAISTPSIQMEKQNDGTVMITLEDFNYLTTQGMEIELEANKTIADSVIFQGLNDAITDFIKIDGKKLTLYFVDDEALFNIPTIELGCIKGLGDISFLPTARIKAVNNEFAATELIDVQLEYVGGQHQDQDQDQNQGQDQDQDDDQDQNQNQNQGQSENQNQEQESRPELVPTFTDTKGHWAEKGIQEMVQKGVLKGYEDGSFKPNHFMTRVEIATVVNRLFKFQEKSQVLPFSDVKAGQWYTEAVNNLYVRKIIYGREDGTFGLLDNVTNQDAIAMLSRALEGLDIELEKERKYSKFADEGLISGYAKEAVQSFYEAGIISGTPENYFNPRQPITRAQVALIANRILEKIEGTFYSL